METCDRIRILVVEDEAPIRDGLCDVLAFRGYQPEGVERGDEGLARAQSGEFALVILDIMLPGMNGFEVCEGLRQALPAQPILMLTARGSEEDVLQGFRCGADDYVIKPFSVAELVARVEALLRRSGTLEGRDEPPARFAFGDWEVDTEQLVASRDGERHDLNRRDAEILALLAREKGRIVSRRLLLREIWGYPEPERVETRTVDMHIAKLRKKLVPSDGGLIETVRGEGYRYSG